MSGTIDETPAPAPRPPRERGGGQRRIQRNEINGWINLDKPVGVTSTQAVAQLKFLFNAKKVGHAGTLDPLASGVLPIAFGEATKTVSVVQEGTKFYRFAVRWGQETDTDDAEGKVVTQSDARPSPADIAALLPQFIGTIQQTPPQFSAIKIAGERAYDLARGGAERGALDGSSRLSVSPARAIAAAEISLAWAKPVISPDTPRKPNPASRE